MPPDGYEIDFKNASLFRKIAGIVLSLLMIIADILLMCSEVNPIIRVIALIIIIAVFLTRFYIIERHSV